MKHLAVCTAATASNLYVLIFSLPLGSEDLFQRTERQLRAEDRGSEVLATQLLPVPSRTYH